MGARVALVEDHAGTRAAIVQSLLEARGPVVLVDAFADGEAFLESPVRSQVDVALIDLGLPGASGCEVIRRLSRESPTLKTIALTVFEDEDTVFAALESGARGFLLKDEPIERLVCAIEDVLCGRRPLSAGVTRFFIDQALRFSTKVQLTDRETSLAHALANGASYAECAEHFGIALGTVQDHVKRIYRKLDVSSKRELRLWVEHNAP